MRLSKPISFFDPRLGEWLAIKLKMNTTYLFNKYRMRGWEKR